MQECDLASRGDQEISEWGRVWVTQFKQGPPKNGICASKNVFFSVCLIIIKVFPRRKGGAHGLSASTLNPPLAYSHL